MIYPPGITADTDAPITKLLVREEGLVLHAYPDSEGYLTIGIGTLIDQRKGGGISRPEAYLLLGNRLQDKERGLDRVVPWWRKLDPVRRDVILAMAYQMGADGVAEFHNTMAAVERGDWKAAAAGMRASKWHRKDSPARAERMATAMELGVL